MIDVVGTKPACSVPAGTLLKVGVKLLYVCSVNVAKGLLYITQKLFYMGVEYRTRSRLAA